MNAVQLLCETAVWMDNGSIREIGPVDEIARRYEADFRRQEDAHLREGNAQRAALTDTKVLPSEIGRPDIWRLRVTGPGGRVHDTHYIRRLEVVIAGRELEVPLEFAHIDDVGVDTCLDVAASEWGRMHDRQGSVSRTLAPGSSLLRGGHVLLRMPLGGQRSEDVGVRLESVSLGGTETLKVQFADAATGEWLDLEPEDRTRLERGWERAEFRGALHRASESAHTLRVERVAEETRPDVEIRDVQLIVDGREGLAVQEREPFTIAIQVHAERRVPVADVWVKIVRSDGFYVFWQSSGQVGQNLEDLEGTVVVSFHFDPNLFGAGDYEVEVDVADGFDLETNWPHRQVYDRRVGALKFTVAREWRLVMFGAVNHRFPVSVEPADVRELTPTVSVRRQDT
jgi:lipopolysaccharide transport system ATP-binding protein